MKEKIKRPAKKIKYEWLWYAHSFLELARIGCENLLRQNYKRNDNMVFMLYNSKKLLISIFFNIKHSLELFLKALDINLTEHFLPIHDIESLLCDLKKNIEKTIPRSEHRKRILNKFKEGESLFKKYIFCQILKEGKIEDTNNVVFRYPEDNGVNFDVTEKMKNFDREEINEILRDINKFNNLFHIVDYRIAMGRFYNNKE